MILKVALLVGCFMSCFGFSKDVSSRLTIITLTSPASSNPRTFLLQLTQYSLYKNIPNFFEIPKIIVFDGAKNPLDEPNYNAFKGKVKELAEFHPHFQNTEIVFCKEHGHYSGALREALRHTKTEYAYIHQEDLELLQPLDLQGLLDAMDQNHNIKFVRLNDGINALGKSNTCDFYIDNYIEGGSAFPLLRTCGFGDHDQISRKDYYEELVFPYIGDAKIFPDGIMMGKVAGDFLQDPKLHLKWGTYLYGGYGDGPFIRHLDRKSPVW